MGLRMVLCDQVMYGGNLRFSPAEVHFSPTRYNVAFQTN